MGNDISKDEPMSSSGREYAINDDGECSSELFLICLAQFHQLN